MADAKHFEKIARTYSRSAGQGIHGFFRDREVTAVLRYILENKPQSILDLGCGSGIYAKLILKNLPGTYVWGYDQSSSMIREFQKTGAVGFVRNLSELDPVTLINDIGIGSVDIILILGVFEFIENLAEMLSRLAEIKKGFKRQSLVVVLLPRDNLMTSIYLLWHHYFGQRTFARTINFYLHSFENAGFKLELRRPLTAISELFVFV